MHTVLVTGGAGFIGSHFVELCLKNKYKVVVLDALTYAGNIANLSHLSGYELVVGNICDAKLVAKLLNEFKPEAVFNFAAESHVDRSISGPDEFIQTNVVGTYVLLQQCLNYYSKESVRPFKYVQVSTDEVFGELGPDGFFNEFSPYKPRSPYSACKASGDHLVNAWHHTFGLPTVITHCSNNYGARQFPEKLIPYMVLSALKDKPLGIYGEGKNVRDWIHVEDHCRGVWLAYEKGKPGSTYCFGGGSERTNIEVVQNLCSSLNELAPRKDNRSHVENITFVKDRLGHDWRYAIDDRLAREELGFGHVHRNFEEGLRETVKWYVENVAWCEKVLEAKS